MGIQKMGKKDRGIIHNDFVRRKKKAEYHTKKKIENKWKRQKTHVEAEQAGGHALFDQIFSGQLDVKDAEDEYEKKLRGCKSVDNSIEEKMRIKSDEGATDASRTGTTMKKKKRIKDDNSATGAIGTNTSTK